MESAEYQAMDAGEAAMWWYRALHARLLAILAPIDGKILDAGCGTGGLLARLGAARPEIARVGLEWHPDAARRAAAKSGAPVVRGTVGAIPFAAASFSAAVLADVLCHRAVEPRAALSEVRRVLRPGGLLVVNMPAYEWLLSHHDRAVHNARRQTAGQVRRMLADAGFASIRAGYWNGLLLPAMILERKLLRRPEAAAAKTRFPPWLNATLQAVTDLERRLGWKPPAGGSVLATARRPDR